MWRMNYLQRKAPDSVRVCLAELEQWTQRPEANRQGRAVHADGSGLQPVCVRQELEHQSTNGNGTGVVPDDMDEWGPTSLKRRCEQPRGMEQGCATRRSCWLHRHAAMCRLWNRVVPVRCMGTTGTICW